MSIAISRNLPFLPFVLIATFGWLAFSNSVQKCCLAIDNLDTASSVVDQTDHDCQSDCHSLWELSTRCLMPQSCADEVAEELEASQFLAGVWTRSSESQLLADIAAQPAWTILFVHGNRTSLEMSRCNSKALFQSLQQRASRPIRLISLTWPSEKPRPLTLPAVRVDDKKELIRSTGIQLAEFMHRMDKNTIQAMVGFSFGSAIIGCALHLHNGGEIVADSQTVHCCHETLREPSSHCKCLRIGFIAPAMDRCALQPNGEYNRALESVGHLVNLYNSRDPILRRFRFFDPDHPVAAGYAGLLNTKFQPLAGDTRIRQYDCRTIGASHALSDYCRCRAYEDLLANVLGEVISATVGSQVLGN